MVTEEFQSGIRVLPIYIVCDESSSMAGASIQAVNDGIVELFYEVSSDPFVDAKVRVGIVTFNDTARVLFPLTKLSDVTQIPVCVASGSSSFSAAFRLLKTQLETDVSSLRQQFSVLRPVIFFITNGQPNNENWRDELNRLIDPEFLFRPNIVGIGVTGAGKSVVEEISHWESASARKVVFMAESGGNPVEAIIEFVRPLFQAVITSKGSQWLYFSAVDDAIIRGRSTSEAGIVRMHVVGDDA